MSYASNLLNALLNIKVCNNEKQIVEAIEDCFNGKDLCGKDACEYVKTETEDIMGRINVKEFKNYYFYAEKETERKDFIKNKDCNADSVGMLVDRTVSGLNNNENYIVTLKIC